MAITDCLRCGETYLEQEKVCPQCGTGSLDLAVISDYAKRMHRTALEKEVEKLGWDDFEVDFFRQHKALSNSMRIKLLPYLDYLASWLNYLWTEIKAWH